MPYFDKSPFASSVRLLVAGVASHFFGSWRQDQSPTQMYVTSVAITANVATVAVTVYGGEIPAVGSLISIKGTQSNGGEFNVTNAALTAVNIASNGSGTVSFALAAANVATTNDAGTALVPVPEVPEAIANGASVPVAMPNSSFGGDLDRTVTAVCNFPTLPTAVTVSLQGSLFNDDAQFQTLGVVATVAGGVVTANGLTVTAKWMFYRALVSGLNGSGTFTTKIHGA